MFSGGGGGVTSIGGGTRCLEKKKTRKKGIQIRGGGNLRQHAHLFWLQMNVKKQVN